jgi:hypothetical protein
MMAKALPSWPIRYAARSGAASFLTKMEARVNVCSAMAAMWDLDHVMILVRSDSKAGFVQARQLGQNVSRLARRSPGIMFSSPIGLCPQLSG